MIGPTVVNSSLVLEIKVSMLYNHLKPCSYNCWQNTKMYSFSFLKTNVVIFLCDICCLVHKNIWCGGWSRDYQTPLVRAVHSPSPQRWDPSCHGKVNIFDNFDTKSMNEGDSDSLTGSRETPFSSPIMLSRSMKMTLSEQLNDHHISRHTILRKQINLIYNYKISIDLQIVY